MKKSVYLFITPKGEALHTKIHLAYYPSNLMENYQKELSYTFPSLTKEKTPPTSYTYPTSWQNFKKYIRKIRGKENKLDRIITYVPIEEVKQLIQTQKIPEIDDINLNNYSKKKVTKWIEEILPACIKKQNTYGYCPLYGISWKICWRIYGISFEGEVPQEAQKTALAFVSYLIEKGYVEAAFCSFDPDKIEKLTLKNYRKHLEKKKYWEFVSWWQNCLGLLITPKGRALQKKFEVVEEASSLMKNYQKELA